VIRPPAWGPVSTRPNESSFPPGWSAKESARPPWRRASSNTVVPPASAVVPAAENPRKTTFRRRAPLGYPSTRVTRRRGGAQVPRFSWRQPRSTLCLSPPGKAAFRLPPRRLGPPASRPDSSPSRRPPLLSMRSGNAPIAFGQQRGGVFGGRGRGAIFEAINHQGGSRASEASQRRAHPRKRPGPWFPADRVVSPPSSRVDPASPAPAGRCSPVPRRCRQKKPQPAAGSRVSALLVGGPAPLQEKTLREETGGPSNTARAPQSLSRGAASKGRKKKLRFYSSTVAWTLHDATVEP